MRLLVVFALVISAAFLRTESYAQQAVVPKEHWYPVSRSEGFTVDASGSVFSAEGADVIVKSSVSDGSTSGGSLPLDGTPLERHTLVLSGLLGVPNGQGVAGLWMRADSPAGQIELVNTASRPVTNGDGISRREISMDVPSKATKVLVGVLFKGNGDAHFSQLKLELRELTGLPASVRPEAVVAAAIGIVKEHALASDKLDWGTVVPEIKAAASGATITADTYPAVRLLLSKLGDNHSSLSSPYQAASISSSGQDARRVEVKELPGQVGYVRMPAYFGTDKEKAAAFSDAVSADIDRLHNTRGWIVDLRGDAGGNMWPMMTALRSLLGEGKVGSFVSSAKVTPWFANGSGPAMRATIADLSHIPVAVLIGPGTNSSGEALAIAFHGRPNTEFFGEPSYGRSTANGEFPLPDGSVLHLTTAIDADRNGVAFGGKVVPDHVIADSGNDDALSAAADWLARKR